MATPSTMKAMVMAKAQKALTLEIIAVPEPNEEQVLVKIIACGVCRTDLHIVDGELAHPKLPLIPGHEIVGVVEKKGRHVRRLNVGDFVGIPWLAYTCGECKYCRKGKENLCENSLFTGYTINGGYAQYTVAYEKYCFTLDKKYANASGTPLLCAGLIGYRSYTMIGEHVSSLGIYGFGAAAHILTQLAIYQGKRIFAFTRENDRESQSFALKLGASWVGDPTQSPPEKLDAAIIFAPVGSLVPKALKDLDKGGTVVCGGIHMSDIPSFPYQILWEERMIRSVANLTRKDGDEFLKVAPKIPIHTETQLFPLEKANEALKALREGKIHGAAVLVMHL